jgi:hypothetical protein
MVFAMSYREPAKRLQKSILGAALIVIMLSTASGFAAQPHRVFPFTQSQNQDGSKFVWFIFGRSGFDYDYVPAKDFPKSPHFREVLDPRPGDVAWWPGFIAIVKFHDKSLSSYLTAESERTPEEVEHLYGMPKFYRYLVLDLR